MPWSETECRAGPRGSAPPMPGLAARAAAAAATSPGHLAIRPPLTFPFYIYFFFFFFLSIRICCRQVGAKMRKCFLYLMHKPGSAMFDSQTNWQFIYVVAILGLSSLFPLPGANTFLIWKSVLEANEFLHMPLCPTLLTPYEKSDNLLFSYT